ncbi:hypothetical protein [Burkholderia sp. B21-005]|uniref:hypothetical protein n=1 Tax=Burkholderia sp. B21-005 TaxID=2890406 RepID=UPI001E633F1E|nr:hypothetical protein [Burkholderia sp. B21-005]UEP43167.1 hypothetical protein LMA02_24145 [Burkholderia sp. B21-005]
MKSSVINKNENQLVLDFEPGLTDRFGSARECMAQGVYQRGLKRVAGDLDQAPGNLSVQLSDDPARHLSLDTFEAYLDKTGDLTPLYYLIEKFLGDKRDNKQAAVAQLQAIGPHLVALLKQVGADV